MKGSLPDINRSYTPTKTSFKDLKPGPIKSCLHLKDSRKLSMSPLRLSPFRKDSESTISNPRTVSDETISLPFEKKSFLYRLNSFILNLDSSKQKHAKFKRGLPVKNSSYLQTAEALVSIAKSGPEKPLPTKLAIFFIGLGLSKDYESLLAIFSSLFDFHSSKSNFTVKNIVRICEDPTSDKILKALLQDAKNNYCEERPEMLECLVSTIKKWWSKLDKAKNGFVPLEDISKMFHEMGLLESANERKKIFAKIGQFCTLKQFFSIFSKSLFEFLMENLKEISERKEAKGVSAEISISAYRRKVIIDGLIGENNAVSILFKNCRNVF